MFNSCKLISGRIKLAFCRPTIVIYLLILPVVTACVSTQIVDKQASDLMPAVVAIKIFDENGHGNWVRNPRLQKDVFCGGEWVNVKFSDIDVATYSTTYGVLIFARSYASRGEFFCTQVVRFKVDTQQKANDLVKASRALGTKINSFPVVSGPLP